ncbi:hypothetical protein GCM10027203_37290 [Nonomuraea fastidiosa]
MSRVLCGSPGTVLVVIRGNSGSGKTSVARALRQAYGRRGLALIGQDVVRRDILREHDPQRSEFTVEQMRRWYRERDLLPGGRETIVGQDSTPQETVRRILDATGLAPHQTP